MCHCLVTKLKSLRFNENMETISIQELNELYNDTLQKANSNLLLQDDEWIEGELFEDFDVDVHSFLHENTLERLYKANFLNKEIKDLSFQLRAKAIELLQKERTAEFVRKSNEWRELFELADKIIKLKLKLDEST